MPTNKLVSHFFLLTFATLFLMSCGQKKSSESSANQYRIGAEPVIIGSLDWLEITELDKDSIEKQHSQFVGDVTIPTFPSRCTGFMISPDVLMTNHHCIPAPNFAMGVTVAFRHEKGIDFDQWDKRVCDEFIINDRKLDYALLRCRDTEFDNYGSLSQENSSTGDQLYIIQQNCDYYRKRGCDHTKKISYGKVKGTKRGEYVHNADTLGGSSGSPVFDQTTHQVIAIHHAGLGNTGDGRGIENYAVPMHKIVEDIMRKKPTLLPTSPATRPKDGYEPNNSFSQAAIISFNTVIDEMIGDGKDQDFYKIEIGQTTHTRFLLEFSHAQGDLDLYLYNSKKHLIARSWGVTDSEQINKTLKQGSYFIKIKGYRGAAADYQFLTTD